MYNNKICLLFFLLFPISIFSREKIELPFLQDVNEISGNHYQMKKLDSKKRLSFSVNYEYKSERWREKSRNEYSYDSKGRVIEKVFKYYYPEGYQNYSRTLYEFDPMGVWDNVTLQYYRDYQWHKDNEVLYHYMAGKLRETTQRIFSNGKVTNKNKTFYIYNCKNQDSIFITLAGNFIDTLSRTRFFYDTLGLLFSEENSDYINGTWQGRLETYYKYNNDGILIGYGTSEYRYDNFWEAGSAVSFIFDTRGNIITTIDDYMGNKNITDSYYDGDNDIVMMQKWFKPRAKDTIVNRNLTLFTYENNSTNDIIKNEIIPSEFHLSQNYPNPFNPSTWIKFYISERTDVRLTVYNILGEEIITLVNEKLNAGEHQTIFNAKGLPSGVYFYRLKAGDRIISKKMILAK